jgi:hypothetical protein
MRLARQSLALRQRTAGGVWRLALDNRWRRPARRREPQMHSTRESLPEKLMELGSKWE